MEENGKEKRGCPFALSPESPLMRLTECLCHRHLAVGQGIYYVLGGVWPIVSMGSFLAVTGPKTDLWLVKTTGLLLMVIGAVLITAGARRKVEPETRILALGSAAALALVEIVYVFSGTISWIYLLDAVIEIALIALWLIVWASECRAAACGTSASEITGSTDEI